MPDDPLIGRTVGSYRILSQLGEGGMGAVYRAVHGKLEREVALKILPKRLLKDKPQFLQRFFFEARAAARIDHPNIVRVHDAEEVEGLCYIAMEFVRGIDVRILLTRKSPLTELEALGLTLQAAKGLGAAMKQGIIHRDIKPANLMLTSEGVLKIADFGLAKSLLSASEITRSGQILGTPAYMSPEQADGLKVDFRTDIYSLGICLFEMAVGDKPYKAETPVGLIKKQLLDPVPDPLALKPALHPGFRSLIMKMMAKSRDHRFASYEELQAELVELRGKFTRKKQAALKADTSAEILAIVESSSETLGPRPVKQDARGAKAASSPESSVTPSTSKLNREEIQSTLLQAKKAFFAGMISRDEYNREREELQALLKRPGTRILTSRGKTPQIVLPAGFAVPEAGMDQVGNPVVTRDAAKFDGETGYPFEIWLDLSREKRRLPAIQFVLVKAGDFYMGSPDVEADRSPDEGPIHSMTIPKALYLAKYPVTQGQWEAVMGNNPSNFKKAGKEAPVEQVSWKDCRKFLKRSNELTGGVPLRLPAEAEWEYACRAGTHSRFHSGDAEAELDRVGWYEGNSGETTHPVGKKKPNAWGLYDMHGNVWEWCEDLWCNYCEAASRAAGEKSEAGSFRVLRGGSWSFAARFCRSAYRGRFLPATRNDNYGFRLAFSPVLAGSPEN